MPDAVRLLLVDDHAVVRTGLKMLLDSVPDMDIVGQTGSGREALELADSLRPDVVIMDLTLPDISGIEATQRIKEKFPEIAVVALTIHEDEAYFFRALQAGAAGYVPKRAAPEDLISAIRAALAGEVYIYPSLTRLLVSDYLARRSSTGIDCKLEELTPREQEVLELVAHGATNDEIADKLSISRHTVARHRENLMSKLQLHSRSELVKFAIRSGLIDP